MHIVQVLDAMCGFLLDSNDGDGATAAMTLARRALQMKLNKCGAPDTPANHPDVPSSNGASAHSDAPSTSRIPPMHRKSFPQ